MRVLLLADLQLEAGLSLGHGEYGPGSRFHDQEQALDRIADIADEEDVELAILAGDTFDRPKPSPWAILAMQRFLERMPQVLAIVGNHDVKSLALPSVMELFRGRANVSTEPNVATYDGLVVATLPWHPIGKFAEEENAPTDRDELNAYAGMTLGRTAQALGQKVVDADRKILIAHWAVGGATTSAGVSAEVFREPIIPLEALVNAGFDMVALGHLHQLQVLNQEPPVLYLGSPMVHSFGDAGEPHGVWIYSSDEPEMRFVPVPDRQFATIDWDPSSGVDFSMMEVGGLEQAVVRVRYEVSEAIARKIDQNVIRNSLLASGVAKVFIQPTIIRESRARVESVDTADLSPERALDLWFAADGTDLEQSARARTLHAEYMERLA